MAVQEFVFPSDSDLQPCPMGCGRITEDVAGGPCDACWSSIDEGPEDMTCVHCGSPYDGGHRCGTCGNGDPEGSGEFDPETGEQW